MPQLSHSRVGSINLRPVLEDDYPETGLRLQTVYQAEAFLGIIRLLIYGSVHGPVFLYSYALRPAVDLEKQDDCTGLKMMVVLEGTLAMQGDSTERCLLPEGTLCLFRYIDYRICLPENARVKYLLFSVDPLIQSMVWDDFAEGRYSLTARMLQLVKGLLHPPAVLASPEKWLTRQLVNLLYQLSEASELAGGAASDKSYQFDYVLEADALIQSDLSRAYTIKELARKVGLNERYLKRAFKNYFSTGMARRRNVLRIDLAKRLLRESNKTIAEIAILSGYKSINTFRYNFERATGMLPADWRKKYRL